MATVMIKAAEGAAETTGTTARRPFAEVARENLDRLYGYCVHLSGDRMDAEDLLQDVLIRAMIQNLHYQINLLNEQLRVIQRIDRQTNENPV